MIHTQGLLKSVHQTHTRYQDLVCVTSVISTYSGKDPTAGNQRTLRSTAHLSDQSLSTTTSSCLTPFGMALMSAMALVLANLLNHSVLPPWQLCKINENDRGLYWLSVNLLFFYGGNKKRIVVFSVFVRIICIVEDLVTC